MFPVALGLIGISLGSAVDVPLIWDSIMRFGWAIVFGIAATIGCGLVLAFILHRSTSIDKKTAVYSFIPGGASEVLGLADRDGANISIVAAFHSVRVILFVGFIPVFVGVGAGQGTRTRVIADILSLGASILPIVLILFAAISVHYLFPIPAGPLLFSTIIMVLLAPFASFEVPVLLAGIGQMLIGASVGLRFNRETLQTLREIKWTSIGLVVSMVGMTILIGVAFSLWARVDVFSAVLGWIPAGAGEMSSTAIVLQLDEMTVITVQLIRLYTVFFCLPLFVYWLNK